MPSLRNSYRQCNHDDDDDDLFSTQPEIRVIEGRYYTCHSRKVVLLGLLGLVLAVVALSVVCLFSLRGLFNEDAPRSPSNASTYEPYLSPVVKTNCGQFLGVVEDGAYVFKGVPYAQPPVGVLRWRKPVPLWTDQRWCTSSSRYAARNFGSPCFQLNPYSRQFEGGEDCLYLNVWTPTLETLIWK